jgi:Fur family transcriptional regulator, ferric uptake regulator
MPPKARRATSRHAEPERPSPAEGAGAHRDTLASYVARKALKWTRQREVILETFLGSHEHLTCEDIHARVVKADPTIGLATVYRTLRLFVEAGIASERRFQEGVTRYEPQQPHHDHLICVRCGSIVEFESDPIEELQEEVARAHGFRLLSHRHELYGACPRCRE